MTIRHWLPSPQQMSDAVQLRTDAYTGTTMRQALGMIAVVSILAGLIPFIDNWIVAARVGAALPLARAALAAHELSQVAPRIMVGTPVFAPNMNAIINLLQTLAGLQQPLPGWLAAGLSSVGAWLSWPLAWLARWLVYGLGVMVAAKLLGTTITLQRFYAATGYVAVPLLLTGLAPIPCLGPLASLVGSLWALAVYVRAVQISTELSLGRAILAVLLPLLVIAAGVLIAFSLAFLGAALLSL